jgi:hypothetical protein
MLQSNIPYATGKAVTVVSRNTQHYVPGSVVLIVSKNNSAFIFRRTQSNSLKMNTLRLKRHQQLLPQRCSITSLDNFNFCLQLLCSKYLYQFTWMHKFSCMFVKYLHQGKLNNHTCYSLIPDRKWLRIRLLSTPIGRSSCQGQCCHFTSVWKIYDHTTECLFP